MGIVIIYQYLHLLFFIGILFSLLFTHYKQIMYLNIAIVLIFIAWILYGCFIKDYEMFIEWKYDGNHDLYTHVQKLSNYPLYPKPPNKIHKKREINNIQDDIAFGPVSLADDKIRTRVWWTAMFLFFSFICVRYYFKFNLFVSTNIPIAYTFILFSFLFIILVIPACHHLYETGNIKLFSLFSSYLITIFYLMYHYYDKINVAEP